MKDSKKPVTALPVTVPKVTSAPSRGERLVMMTDYDFSQARLVDQSDLDIDYAGVVDPPSQPRTLEGRTRG